MRMFVLLVAGACLAVVVSAAPVTGTVYRVVQADSNAVPVGVATNWWSGVITNVVGASTQLIYVRHGIVTNAAGVP